MPNSLVITDVADNTTIVGVPARIKLRGGRPREFYPVLGGSAKSPAKQQTSATTPEVADFGPAEPKMNTPGARESQTEVTK